MSLLYPLVLPPAAGRSALASTHTLEVHNALSDVPAAAWDALVGDGCAFLEHAFLRGLERTGCVGGDSGWDPRYVLVRSNGALVAALPVFLKSHSQGEFIFDFAWADAAQRAGLRYYPKLVVGAPFSPVAGPRCLLDTTRPDADALRGLLVDATRALARREAASSVHWLFTTAEEATFLEARGLGIRHTIQFHWQNEGYRTFEDFINRFRSDRRNQIRRERRAVQTAGIVVSVVAGDQLTAADEALAWACYTDTIEKFPWGQRYLNRSFFAHLFKHFRHRLLMVRADLDGRPVACTLNVHKGGHLYGRYWGCLEEHRHLHFEVCSYAGIEAAIGAGLQRFEAGAGGGGHKFGRGFLPQVVFSAHDIFLPALDRAVRDFLVRERASIAAELVAVEGHVLKPQDLAILELSPEAPGETP